MTASTAHVPARHATDEDRPILIVLIVGTIVALACAFGPVWFARAGVVIAAALAVGVWAAMLRTVRQLRRQHVQELTALSLRAAEEMRAERAREQATLAVIEQRTTELNDLIASLRGELDSTVKELDEAYATIVVRETEIGRQRDRALHAEKQVAVRQEELAARQHDIAVLNQTIRGYEDELAALQAQQVERAAQAEMAEFPRRRQRSHQSRAARRA